MEFNSLGLIVWAVNGILFYFLNRTKNIGKIMGGAISGYISMLVGLLILYSEGALIYLTITIVLYIAIGVAILIVYLYHYANSISSRNKIGYYIVRIGIIIGIVTGFIVSITK